MEIQNWNLHQFRQIHTEAIHFNIRTTIGADTASTHKLSHLPNYKIIALIANGPVSWLIFRIYVNDGIEFRFLLAFYRFELDLVKRQKPTKATSTNNDVMDVMGCAPPMN